MRFFPPRRPQRPNPRRLRVAPSWAPRATGRLPLAPPAPARRTGPPGPGYSAQLDVTAAGANLTYRVSFRRWNSALSAIRSTTNNIQAEAVFSGTGLKL